MPALPSSKHEHFAQGVAKGLSAIDAYVKAGYQKSGSRQGGSRLLSNVAISGRIEELKTRISDAVVTAEIRKRSWRIAQYQDTADRINRLLDARAKLYGGQMGEERTIEVADARQEKAAIAEGFTLPAPVGTEPPVDTPAYPRTMHHPGYLIGGDTGLLTKDYRGKNAEQPFYKIDSALIAERNANLKQAAIEEGQWSEKRESSTTINITLIKARLHAGRQRVVDEARARVREIS